MDPTRVVALRIKTFRRFQDISIPFGERITLIAGQNGTSKSTLLGMLAQPFSFGVIRGKTARTPDHSAYTTNYHGLVLSDFRDLAGRPFMYDCDDVFRLSQAHDIGKQYEYRTELSPLPRSDTSLPDKQLLTVSRHSKVKGTAKKRMRFVTGPGTSHKPGEGNYPHPVIYLGLNRLWPLAKAKGCTFPSEDLSAQDREWYVNQYNDILCLEERDNSARFMDTQEKKRFISPESKDYDGESCSAGQDNLSQILTAILSFRRLKEKLGDRYRGGMFLIDEVDATFHARAQKKLLEVLSRVSEELALQVIATSHSLYLIERAYRSNVRNDVSVLYLVNLDGSVALKHFSNFDDLADHLKVEATLPSREKPRKVPVALEDDVGEEFFNHICGSKLNRFITRGNVSSLGAGRLKNLADYSRIIPLLKEVVFITDGDMAKEWQRKPENLIALPGGKSPEMLIFQHLSSLRESDPFWESIGASYTKQFAITDEVGSSVDRIHDTAWVKSWYQRQRPYWGDRKNAALKSWIHANPEECLRFCKKFIKLLRGRYRGEVPESLIEKVYAQYGGPKRSKR